jgi:hypothetical protein
MKAESRNNLNGLKPIALFDLRDNPQEKEEKNLIENQEYKDKVEKLLNKYLEYRNTGKSTVDAST